MSKEYNEGYAARVGKKTYFWNPYMASSEPWEKTILPQIEWGEGWLAADRIYRPGVPERERKWWNTGTFRDDK